MFSLKYRRSGKYNDTIDEIRITYHQDLENFEAFLQEHSEQRVVLCIEGEFSSLEVSLFVPFLKYSNWALRFDDVSEEVYVELQKFNIPFFSNKKVSNWDALSVMLNLGVSDVYVTEELCFELDKVAAVVHRSGAKVRLYPNIAQANCEIDPLKKFFIRPEDIEIYDDYVDVYEFFLPADTELSVEEVLYEAYKEERWFGPLNEIIIGLDSDIDSRYMSTQWGIRRVRCGKKCLKDFPCDLCNTIYQLSKTLEQGGILLSKESAQNSQTEEELSSKYQELRDKILDIQEKIKNKKR